MSYIQQVSAEKNIALSVLCDSLRVSRASLYRFSSTKDNDVPSPQKKPHNALNDEERQRVLDLLHSERFADHTPYEVFYTLLDEDEAYVASIRTMYRILYEEGETKDRRDVCSHRDAIKPELIATAPNEVWSWDITKLLSTRRFTYYHLYVVMDIYSRYIVGWMVADRECQYLAKSLLEKAMKNNFIVPNQLTIHSDNGPSMTSQTVAQFLERMGVNKTHNRPYTSNDNPFSESHFKTLKYRPEFPERFESLQEAEAFCQNFFNWYNHYHYHSGIQFLTPDTVHACMADHRLKTRHETLLKAFQMNPERFNYKKPTLKKISPAYINPPKKKKEENVENIIDSEMEYMA